MSISGNSVLRRILDEVRGESSHLDLETVERRDTAGAVLEIRRTHHVHRPPFSTSLHFWAHSLRAFLDGRGRPDVFAALANHCLCEATEASRIGPALEALGRRVSPAHSIAPPTSCHAGYRMIDQEGLVSWVAESDDEFWALFWARPRWLEQAQPLVLE